MEHFNREILIKKDKKFHRDKIAFQESRTYNWKNAITNRTKNRYAKNVDTMSEASSMSSVSPKGSFRQKTSRKTKRSSQGNWSHEKNPKKRITDSRTMTDLPSPHLVTDKIGSGGSTPLTSSETNTFKIEHTCSGDQPPSTLPDNFLVSPTDNPII